MTMATTFPRCFPAHFDLCKAPQKHRTPQITFDITPPLGKTLTARTMTIEAITASAPEHNVVLFDVADRSFAISVASVQEIVPMATLSRPPVRPSLLEGFLNLGGVPVAVVRLDTLFCFSKQPLKPYSPLIVLRSAENPVALLVERVIGIASAPSTNFVTMQDHSSFNGCIESAVHLDTGVVHVVSVARLLLERERRAIAEFQVIEAGRLLKLAGSPA
jgi:purine-binding chemotaxis protein CheW